MEDHEDIMRAIDNMIADHLGTSEEENIIPDPEEDDPQFGKIRGMIGTYSNEGSLDG